MRAHAPLHVDRLDSIRAASSSFCSLFTLEKNPPCDPNLANETWYEYTLEIVSEKKSHYRAFSFRILRKSLQVILLAFLFHLNSCSLFSLEWRGAWGEERENSGIKGDELLPGFTIVNVYIKAKLDTFNSMNLSQYVIKYEHGNFLGKPQIFM